MREVKKNIILKEYLLVKLGPVGGHTEQPPTRKTVDLREATLPLYLNFLMISSLLACHRVMFPIRTELGWGQSTHRAINAPRRL